MSENFMWYCDECRNGSDNPITFEVKDKAIPQMYLSGFHIHIQGRQIPIDFCIWVNKEGITELARLLADRYLEMEMGERLRKLIYV